MKYDFLNNIENKEERNLNNSLGVTILRDGTPIYYGDINQKGILHGESFEKEVENNVKFKKLNICMGSCADKNFYMKAVVLAAQGIINVCNSNRYLLVYSPDNLSTNQAMVMQKLNEEFFDKYRNVIIALVDENGEYQDFSLNDYLDICSKSINSPVKR